MKRTLFLILFLAFSSNLFAQSTVFALRNAVFETIGYWQDSIIYNLKGKPEMLVRGSAVINKDGEIEGWTDNAGILFGKDGQMKNYTIPLPEQELKSIKLDPNTAHFKSISLKNIFIPLKCYDFIPLESAEEAKKVNDWESPTSIDVIDPGKEMKNQKMIEINEKMAESSSRMARVLEGSPALALKSINRSNEMTPQIYRMQAREYREESEKLKDKNTSSQYSFPKRTKQSRNQFSYPTLIKYIRLSDRAFKSGKPLTEMDSLLALSDPEGIYNYRPISIFVHAYNITNQSFEKADSDYADALHYFNSGYKHYLEGDFIEATQYALRALKNRSNYVNALFLAASGAKMSENYELALSLLNRLKQKEHTGTVEALKAEIYFLMGDKNKPEKLLQKANNHNAKDWSLYIREKYKINTAN